MSRQHKIRRILRSVVGFILLALWIPLTPAMAISDEGASHEYQVKAAFIYNFIRFTDWPTDTFKDTSDPIRIAVVGHKNLSEAFSPFIDKPINGRKIVMVHKKETELLGPCHVAFFTRCKHPIQDGMLTQLSDASVLIVGEKPGFGQSGGMINFVIKDRRIRFEINPVAAEQAGLKISSKLLQLATIVEKQRP